MDLHRAEIEQALTLLGQLLEPGDQPIRLVVIGGTAINLLGFVARTTTDVDVLALAVETASGNLSIEPPSPLPEALLDAAAEVARDLNLDPDWINTGPEKQWDTGLPPGLEERIEWRDYGVLSVGLAGRRDLIFFKLYAAADDRGPQSVHFQDLLALRPTVEELEAARDWIRTTQDPTLDETVLKVIHHARLQSS